MTTIMKRVRDWLMPVSLTLLFFIVLRGIFLVGYVPSESMEPTLPKNSIILGTRIIRDIKVGDIIVFRRNGVLMVKRVAAIPGDTVDWDALEYMDLIPRPKRDTTIMLVPDGCYFVLGDNTQNSLDSRYWEQPFVRMNDIISKIYQ